MITFEKFFFFKKQNKTKKKPVILNHPNITIITVVANAAQRITNDTILQV